MKNRYVFAALIFLITLTLVFLFPWLFKFFLILLLAAALLFGIWFYKSQVIVTYDYRKNKRNYSMKWNKGGGYEYYHKKR